MFDIDFVNDWIRCSKEELLEELCEDEDSCHDIIYEVSHFFNFKNMCKIRSNKSSIKDYTSIFLSHNQLYVLTKKWDIKSLKTLMLSKLHVTLCEYKLYEARYDDFVELIKYMYKHTSCRKRMNSLRELVTQYVTHEQTQIVEFESCLALIESDKSFARNLISMMLETMRTMN